MVLLAAHLVTYENFNDAAVWNELGIVLVGVGFAILFNLFNGNYEHKRHIVTNMRDIENRMQMIMGAMSAYLSNKKMETDVFESSALLFHIFMDIEDLLIYKKHFIDNLDKTQKKHYWKAG